MSLLSGEKTNGPGAHDAWHNARRIVIKIGSALLVDRASGRLRRSWFYSLIEDVAALRKAGREVIIVSSGAISLGRSMLDVDGQRAGASAGSSADLSASSGVRQLRLDESQAAAAVGQIALARAYQEALADHGLTVGQLLLTADDTEQRRRYLNARSTMLTLLEWGVVPVVNENDTVATIEIRYGDNDRLAARVATMATADCLVLLSDVDGLYTAPPAHAPDARHIPEVRAITPDIEAMAGESGSPFARGGMITKLAAARIATDAGTHMALTLGAEHNPLRRLERGDRATWFLAASDPASARKRWISGSLRPMGSVTIDDGAAAALAKGRSLLPAGVVAVAGDFQRGDPVTVRTRQGAEVGRGLIAYDAAQARAIMGLKSSHIANVLGYEGRPELIHRDMLVVDRRAG